MEEAVKKSNKGITLIALVVTIIVLIILAGVSISLVLGENGIISKAKVARAETEKAEIIEKARMDILGVQSDAEHKGNITEVEVKAIIAKYDKDYTETNTNTIKTNEEVK